MMLRKLRQKIQDKPVVPPPPPLQVANAAGQVVIDLPGERVDQLRLAYTHLGREKPLPKHLGLVAAVSGEGVTTTVIGLAAVMAADLEAELCLVDLNWQRPALAERLQVEPGVGVVQVAGGECELEEALHPCSLTNLSFLAAGALAETERSRFSRSQSLRSLVARLGERFDYVLFDLPAILTTPDAAPLAGLAANLILVLRQGITPWPVVRKALDEVEHIPMRGVILNAGRISTPRWILRWVPGGGPEG